MKEKYVIFHVDGGIGKNIMATAVVRAIQKTFPDRKIIVVASHEEFWINNPRIERLYNTNQLTYFYRDYIENCDTIIFSHDPYRDNGYIQQNQHLVEVWCNMFNIVFDGITPEIYYTPREIRFIETSYNIKDPFVIIQPHGGAQQQEYSWTRDIPLENGLEIVNYYKNNGLKVFQIKTENQPLIPGAEALTLPVRHIVWLLKYAQERILIDSFAQHGAAALGLESKVIWIANSPTVFGYQLHNNIVCALPEVFRTDKYSYMLKYDAIMGNVHEFPYNDHKLFDTNLIINAGIQKLSSTSLLKSSDKKQKEDK